MRLNNDCTVFQAELCGIRMAIDWIQNQRKTVATYAINVDPISTIIAIANKNFTHPIAVDTRRKTIELRKDISIKIHCVKGHSRLQGNEKADYMAKIEGSYKPNITHDAIPISRGRGYWKITIQEYGTRHIATLRKDHTPKHSSPQYITERPKPSGQTMSLHNS